MESPLQQAETPQNSPKLFGKNLFILIFIAFIFSGLGFVGGYLYAKTHIVSPRLNQDLSLSPTPAPNTSPTSIPIPITSVDINKTANWKTFQDPYYKYSLKYPPEWKVRAMYDNTTDNTFQKGLSTYTFIQGLEFSDPKGASLGLFSIEISPNPSKVPLIEWLNNLSDREIYGKHGQIMDTTIPDQPNYTINGIPAVWMYYPGGQSSPTIDIYLANESNIYLLSFALQTDTIFDEVYAGVISSFNLLR